MTGPLTGTKAFSSDRFQVVTKSPLTGIFGEANAGGTWGSALKRSGYDGLIITGKSDTPVYVSIVDKKVEIHDANDLWGLDTFETDKKLKDLAEGRVEVACIGPAGEKLVKYANISTCGPHARVAGRAGCGTVMGSKNLKAIVASGTHKTPIHDEAALTDFVRKNSKSMVENDITKFLNNYGTFGCVEAFETFGNLPVKNWSEIRFANAGQVTGELLNDKKYLKKRYHCGRCVIGCGPIIEIKDGEYATEGEIGGPEYESGALLGPNLCIDNLEILCKLNELCNRYGMDTMTAGSVLGFVMECYEKGIVDKDRLDGIDLVWGDGKAALEMLRKIGEADGVGKLLGEGTRILAEVFGGNSEEFAPHVKGLEIPAHDPRAKMGSALAYATSNRGACHMSANTSGFEAGVVIEGMGFDESPDRFEVENKPEFVMKWENLMGMLDTIPACKFIMSCGISLQDIVDTLNSITGFELSAEDFLKTGERIFNLKRMYNNNCGITRKDDWLPSRFLTWIKEEGDSGHAYPPLGKMLGEYYVLRGWDEIGTPKTEKIQDLDLIEYKS